MPFCSYAEEDELYSYQALALLLEIGQIWGRNDIDE